MTKKKNHVRRFAEGTKVPVAQTKQEIDRLLEKHAAHTRIQGTDDLRGVNLVAFTMGGRQVRYELPHNPGDPGEQRRVWRALLLIIKAKLELIAGGDSTVDVEFLPNIVLPNGNTVGQLIGTQLDEMYASGTMPPLLGPAPTSSQGGS